MVEQYQNRGFLTVFYNLRKPCLRALVTIFEDTHDFIWCKSEEEVWTVIRTNAVREISPLIGDTNEKYMRSRRSSHWMSQSVEY